MYGDGRENLCLDLNNGNFPGGYASDGFLSWSPDGSRVITVSECNIHVWTPGADLVAIRDATVCGIFAEPEWSPDGTRIAFTSEEL